VAGKVPAFQRHLVASLRVTSLSVTSLGVTSLGVTSFGTALAVIGFGYWLHVANVATASAKEQIPATTPMSPQELHRLVKMKSLPTQRFADYRLVFPNRD
jgi:hypothetical protein